MKPRQPQAYVKVSAYLTADEKARLYELAERNERSVMAELRLAVRAHLNGKGK